MEDAEIEPVVTVVKVAPEPVVGVAPEPVVEVAPVVKVRKPAPLPATGSVFNLVKESTTSSRQTPSTKKQTILIATTTPTSVVMASGSAPSSLKNVPFVNKASNSVNGRRVPPQVPAYTDAMDDEIERIDLSDLTLTESLHIQAAESHLEAFVDYINEGRISTNNSKPQIVADVRDLSFLKKFAKYLSYKVKICTVKSAIRILVKLESYKDSTWKASPEFMQELQKFYKKLKVINNYLILNVYHSYEHICLFYI